MEGVYGDVCGGGGVMGQCVERTKWRKGSGEVLVKWMEAAV